MATKFAPYAPPSTVLKVIRHYRSKDVPERISLTNLMQIGVTEALSNRTMAALRFLNLVREDETTTDEFRALRYASDDEYRSVLSGILNTAYKDVLDHISLESAGDRELNNAFIPFSPGGQRSRMISLFLALALEAGWTLLAPTKPASAQATPGTQSRVRRPGAKREVIQKEEVPAGSGEGVVAFGVTDTDLAALEEAEFDEVWAALGKLAKARARAARGANNPPNEASRD
jgi:hypothetical protein